jgi:hypothetical protein
VTRTLAAPLVRHPELVSGSIAQLRLRYRRHSQPNRQIHPMRIFGVNQINLPSAAPILELLFPRNGSLHRAKHLKMRQIIYGIFGRMSGRQTITMLRQAFEQVRGDANIKRSVMLACKYIYAWSSFVSHALESAAKLTLKQVQGDVNFCAALIKLVTLNSFQGPSSMAAPRARSTHD